MEFEEHMQQYAICAEFKILSAQRISGLYVLPRQGNAYIWDAVLFVKHGLYQHCIFKFELHIPEDFPADGKPPRVLFLSDVFHPCVDADGQLDVERQFPKWDPRRDRLWRVLAYVKRCFYQMEDMVSGTCANQEAATLFSTSPELFKIKVEACLRQADIDAVAPPSRDYSIRLSKWDDEVHAPQLAAILQSSYQHQLPGARPTEGLSWVKDGQAFAADAATSGGQQRD